ncbi:MAG TPA: hypothetical protein VFI91_12545 [Longimicrobiaceae bacterium]|nr:hypothetical protein [Longimicrobiaceae bacterium]
MQHLSMEDLAALVDELPTAEQKSHLDGCAICAEELEALRSQTAALGSLPDPAVPPDQWTGIESRLRSEGLVAAPRRHALAGRLSPIAALAASVLLFVSGGAMGAAVWGGAGDVTAPENNTPAIHATAMTVEQAEERVVALEAEYLEALTRYAELSGLDESPDPVNRLAAMEGIVLTTRSALEQAPADPVINGYHLAALGQREAILRQIANTTNETWF